MINREIILNFYTMKCQKYLKNLLFKVIFLMKNTGLFDLKTIDYKINFYKKIKLKYEKNIISDCGLCGHYQFQISIIIHLVEDHLVHMEVVMCGH